MPGRGGYGLFEAYGVELEYMIADRETLAVRPLADRLFHEAAGAFVSDVDTGAVTWSNELVNHVVELKVSRPATALEGLDRVFHRSVCAINERLAPHGALLLPTGAHPLMDPLTETHLWPHEHNEVYALYDRIFDCRGHGWSNLQSTHLNLPFRDDAEFGRLHAAVRVLLPLLPALSASTPILEGALTGFADTRLETYRHNQDRIPSITGRVIPEAVFTEAAYDERIFQAMRRDIAPYDPEGILEPYFLNSRGAIARFDRRTIEIRVLDLQECPLADLAILQGLVAVLRGLVGARWVPGEALRAWDEASLAAIFLDVIREGEETSLRSRDYLRLFGLDRGEATARELWRHLLAEVGGEVPAEAARVLALIVEQGSLSSRIVRRLGADLAPERIRAVYRDLARCLATNTPYG